MNDKIKIKVSAFVANERKIMATPLYEMQDVYIIKQKFKPSERLIERLRAYCDECDFEAVVDMEGE